MNDFESIYHTYFKDVFLYIKSLTHNNDIAEEITAETFFKAMNSLDSFQGTCDIRVWLCQIAKNSYLSYLRKNKRLVHMDEIGDAADEFNFVEFLSDKNDTLEIHNIIHNLKEPYKEVFMLRVFGELTFRQIAQIFHKNENWACVTYHRARLKIRTKLEDRQ